MCVCIYNVYTHTRAHLYVYVYRNGGGGEVSNGPDGQFPPHRRAATPHTHTCARARTHARGYARTRRTVIRFSPHHAADTGRCPRENTRVRAPGRPRAIIQIQCTPRAAPAPPRRPLTRASRPPPPESLCFCHHFGPPPPPPGDTPRHRLLSHSPPCVYTYVYIYICVCMCVCVYIYIYINRERIYIYIHSSASTVAARSFPSL